MVFERRPGLRVRSDSDHGRLEIPSDVDWDATDVGSPTRVRRRRWPRPAASSCSQLEQPKCANAPMRECDSTMNRGPILIGPAMFAMPSLYSTDVWSDKVGATEKMMEHRFILYSEVDH